MDEPSGLLGALYPPILPMNGTTTDGTGIAQLGWVITTRLIRGVLLSTASDAGSLPIKDH